LKISVITPSYNSGNTIETAIRSVLAQDYKNYEHIVVDGASTDGTLDILKRYPHLIWISEPDRGQVHAMNKGLAMATGDIIVNLNADDQFLEGAFSAVLPLFQEGEEMVVGKVLVRSQKPGGVKEWVNDPKTDFASTIRHWEPNAFCVNPVGYFYRREIPAQVPFREESGTKHDLEFYLHATARFRIKKIDEILGVFNHSYDTQTGRDQLLPSYWQPETFHFLERLSEYLPEKERSNFHLDQERGYQLRRRWAALEAFEMGLAKDLIEKLEVVFLPEDEKECCVSRCGFVEYDRIGTRGDWIILVSNMGKVAGKAIYATLKSLTLEVLPAQVYHAYQINPATILAELPQCLPSQCGPPVSLALNRLFEQTKHYLKWKIIAGVRDPLSNALSSAFERCGNKIRLTDHLQMIFPLLEYSLTYFDRQYRDSLGIDIFDYEFDRKKRYSIVKTADLEILLYRFEDLPEIFPDAIEDFLGIPRLDLLQANAPEGKTYAAQYEQMKEQLQVDKAVLDKVYSSRLATHFYTEKEIDAFYRSWIPSRQKSGPKVELADYGLIYDIGLHEGQDTEFYLKKGFKVIAVDANPVMVEKARVKFNDYIMTGQLVVVNTGVVESVADELPPFYVNDRNSEWSSFSKEIAARDNSPYHIVTAPCTTLADLIMKYGAPHYIKIDIEGYDHIALKSLSRSEFRPRFLSAENGNMGMLDMMVSMGYDAFKYVQQNNVAQVRLPYPPREGKLAEHTFVPGASGPFGEETPGEWKTAHEIRKEISRVWDLETETKNPEHKDEIHGWFDLHARFRSNEI
jgi:FkbM family methyltransferase